VTRVVPGETISLFGPSETRHLLEWPTVKVEPAAKAPVRITYQIGIATHTATWTRL
jgi:hypothetical protein